MQLNSLSKYTKKDTEKEMLIIEVLETQKPHLASPRYSNIDGIFQSKKPKGSTFCEDAIHEDELNEITVDIEPLEKRIPPSKVCPKCGRKYPKGENFCFDCLTSLRDIDEFDINAIDMKHEFKYESSRALDDFSQILTKENLIRVNDFDITIADIDDIVRQIKTESLKNLDGAIKQNNIDLEMLTILEKVMLFTKTFVDLDYKSYGQELGYYAFNKITVDDRQLDALQITTMFHELTHFLIKEILTQILCRILDTSRTNEIQSVAAFILMYSPENCLVDEYAAHTVEGRFTLFGYQDYSSFLSIQNSIEMPDDDIEMLKTIGNTLANIAKDILEIFIDDKLLEEIKVQFRKDILDDPNYAQLLHENCILLSDGGFMQALQMIAVTGFAVSMDNTEKLLQINQGW